MFQALRRAIGDQLRMKSRCAGALVRRSIVSHSPRARAHPAAGSMAKSGAAKLPWNNGRRHTVPSSTHMSSRTTTVQCSKIRTIRAQMAAVTDPVRKQPSSFAANTRFDFDTRRFASQSARQERGILAVSAPAREGGSVATLGPVSWLWSIRLTCDSFSMAIVAPYSLH